MNSNSNVDFYLNPNGEASVLKRKPDENNNCTNLVDVPRCSFLEEHQNNVSLERDDKISVLNQEKYSTNDLKSMVHRNKAYEEQLISLPEEFTVSQSVLSSEMNSSISGQKKNFEYAAHHQVPDIKCEKDTFQISKIKTNKMESFDTELERNLSMNDLIFKPRSDSTNTMVNNWEFQIEMTSPISSSSDSHNNSGVYFSFQEEVIATPRNNLLDKTFKELPSFSSSEDDCLHGEISEESNATLKNKSIVRSPYSDKDTNCHEQTTPCSHGMEVVPLKLNLGERNCILESHNVSLSKFEKESGLNLSYSNKEIIKSIQDLAEIERLECELIKDIASLEAKNDIKDSRTNISEIQGQITNSAAKTFIEHQEISKSVHTNTIQIKERLEKPNRNINVPSKKAEVKSKATSCKQEPLKDKPKTSQKCSSVLKPGKYAVSSKPSTLSVRSKEIKSTVPLYGASNNGDKNVATGEKTVAGGSNAYSSRKTFGKKPIGINYPKCKPASEATKNTSTALRKFSSTGKLPLSNMASLTNGNARAVQSSDKTKISAIVSKTNPQLKKRSVSTSSSLPAATSSNTTGRQPIKVTGVQNTNTEAARMRRGPFKSSASIAVTSLAAKIKIPLDISKVDKKILPCSASKIPLPNKNAGKSFNDIREKSFSAEAQPKPTTIAPKTEKFTPKPRS